MGKSIYRKRFVIEVQDWLHAEVKKQAKRHNITMRAYVLRLMMPEVIKRKNLMD